MIVLQSNRDCILNARSDHRSATGELPRAPPPSRPLPLGPIWRCEAKSRARCYIFSLILVSHFSRGCIARQGFRSSPVQRQIWHCESGIFNSFCALCHINVASGCVFIPDSLTRRFRYTSYTRLSDSVVIRVSPREGYIISHSSPKSITSSFISNIHKRALIYLLRSHRASRTMHNHLYSPRVSFHVDSKAHFTRFSRTQRTDSPYSKHSTRPSPAPWADTPFPLIRSPKQEMVHLPSIIEMPVEE